jgi:hypothetical protein
MPVNFETILTLIAVIAGSGTILWYLTLRKVLTVPEGTLAPIDPGSTTRTEGALCKACGNAKALAGRPLVAGSINNDERLNGAQKRYSVAHKQAEYETELMFCEPCYKRACLSLEELFSKFRAKNAKLRDTQELELANFELNLADTVRDTIRIAFERKS